MKKTMLKFLVLLMGLSAGSYAEDIQLWGTPVSPYVRKVQNVLDYKQLNYSQEEVLPASVLKAIGQEVPESFQKASPLGKIPALSVKEGSFADSAVISAFLEKRYPRHSVYPKKSRLYADALWLEKYADTVVTETIHTIFVERVVKPAVLGMDPDEQLISTLIDTKLPAVLSYLNTWLKEHKTYALVGNQLSIADFAIVHHIIDLDASSVQWRDGTYPELESYVTRMKSEKLINQSIPDFLK